MNGIARQCKCLFSHTVKRDCYGGGGGRGGTGLPFKKGRDAHWEISNEPLKGTNPGVAEAEFYP